MNRFAVFIFALLIGFSTTIKATHTESVTITFNESDFGCKQDENGAVEITTLLPLAFYEEDDGPGIPYFTAGVDGCRICVMSSKDDGASYYKVMENVRSATFTDLPEHSNVCITKQNYLPKQFSVWYTEKQTISGHPVGIGQETVYKADVVTIESSTFTNGKITIDSDNVTIDPGITIDNTADITIGKSSFIVTPIN